MRNAHTKYVPTRETVRGYTQKPHRITRTEAELVAEKSWLLANGAKIVRDAIAAGASVKFPVKRGDL